MSFHRKLQHGIEVALCVGGLVWASLPCEKGFRVRGCLGLYFPEVGLEMTFVQVVYRQCTGQANEGMENGKAKHRWQFIEFLGSLPAR